MIYPRSIAIIRNMTNNVILILISGATKGAQPRVEIRGKQFEPSLDLNFFETPAVQYIFDAESYPALYYYQQGARLEETWANVDLVAKLCFGGVISEGKAWELTRLRELMTRRAAGSPSYSNNQR